MNKLLADIQCQLCGHLIIQKMSIVYIVEEVLFYISLKEHEANEINFEKKKMLSLTEEELQLHQDSAVCYNFRKHFTEDLRKIKIIVKLEAIAIFHVNIEQ